jgi:hypothetical protein
MRKISMRKLLALSLLLPVLASVQLVPTKDTTAQLAN